MEDQEMIKEVKKRLKTRQEAAKEIGIDYVNFTRILRGAPMANSTRQKIKDWINGNS